jgi:hypothetical protein
MKAIPTLLIAGLVAAALPVLAHHSFAAEFDVSQPVQIRGVVTKVDWSNPHAYFYVEVSDGTGPAVTWICQTGSPHALRLRGWLPDSVKVGDSLTVDGYRARDGSTLANVWTAVFADGRKLLAGSSRDVSPR